MLTYEKLRNHAGIMLCGDYLTFRCLHQAIHEVNDRSPLIRDKDGAFLGLAFSVRKAYEQQREVIEPPSHEPLIGVRVGVKLLWPLILVQSRVFRESLSYMDHTKATQAIIYDLEATIEAAIKADFGAAADDVHDGWTSLNPRMTELLDLMDARAGLFSSWTRAQRKKLLAPLLATFNPLYGLAYQAQSRSGELDGMIDPADIARWENVLEWPDPRW